MDSFVRLKITLGSGNESEIQELYELLPDRVWSPGDIRPNTKIIEKSIGCIFSSGLEKEASLDQHLAALLLRTNSVAATIKGMSEQNTIEVLCAIYAKSVPSLYFESNIVEGIANLGANFDIDLYLLPEKE